MGLRCLHTSIFIDTPSLEGLSTKAKEDPFPHEMRLFSGGHQPSISWSRGNYIIIISLLLLLLLLCLSLLLLLLLLLLVLLLFIIKQAKVGERDGKARGHIRHAI